MTSVLEAFIFLAEMLISGFLGTSSSSPYKFSILLAVADDEDDLNDNLVHFHLFFDSFLSNIKHKN